MTASVNEWEFTADAASWINEFLAKNGSLPFSRAMCEQRSEGSLKRRDLTLLDGYGRVVLTGEIKLPYQKDGGSPYNAAVVQDARAKALRAGTRYFFTWNINECVLWETATTNTSWKDRNYRSWDVTKVQRENDMQHPAVMDAVKKWLAVFLHELAKIIHGKAVIGRKSPDEKFIEALESSLSMPIFSTLEELNRRYKSPRFKSELDNWMRTYQGWIIYNDPEGVRENLERASRFACYGLVNKLVFYEALLKRYGAMIGKLSVPGHIDTGEALRLHLEGYFAEAIKVTGDYETVFGEDRASIGNRLPFYADAAVPHWVELVHQIHEFDFSKMDYEVIGSIFERLISPEERHKFGQFYTRVEVVDLINSFCISRGEEKVLDPACGGGTFLVRAYARKRELAPNRRHSELLSDLYGVDISHYATHLTTINLATRDLIDDENYPRIARSDFFDVEAHRAFLKLPSRVKTKGLGQIQQREIEIPLLDAVIGNPPYVRQEDILSGKKAGNGAPAKGTKEYYQQLVKRESGLELSGRSDIHCYFWPHAASFLKNDGYLCFVTSSQWLDVEYGFRLQEWILRCFEIVAIFESIDEPWFVGARVATTVTILRRQEDMAKRMQNTVRFVQLRRPVREILANDGTTVGAVKAADDFRDEILSLGGNVVNALYRARLVRQGDLWKEGVQLGLIMKKSKYAPDAAEDTMSGDYYGGKWGVYLRAPDLWFGLLDDFGSKLVPLGAVADIARGVTSGKDSFFFPRDCSTKGLSQYRDAEEFETTFGVPRRLVESGEVKLVLCGEGREIVKPIEAKYLEPEVHSLMEIDGFTANPENCARMVLLVAESRQDLKDTFVLDYIEWGESQGYHTGATCAARATQDREWYDLTGHPRGAMFWPKSQQYKHAIPINEHDLQCNCNLYDIALSKGVDKYVLAGILNSTLVVLSKFQYGRPVGVEGNLKTEVVDSNMMVVPDPTSVTTQNIQRITDAFNVLKQRKAMQFLSERRMRRMAYMQKGKEKELANLSDLCELDMPDRRELDDAVLELLGVKPKKRRDELIDELYTYLRQFFEWTRQKEEKAIVNKKKAKRLGPAKPNEIAVQIYDEIASNFGQLLRQYDPDFLDKSKPFDTYDLPRDGEPQGYRDLFHPHGVVFNKGKKRLALVNTKNPAQDELIITVALSGTRGLVRIPHDEDECRRTLSRYADFIRKRQEQIGELIENRTADEDIQTRVYESLMSLILNRSQ